MKDKEKYIDNSWRAKMVAKGIYKDPETTSKEKQIIEKAIDILYDIDDFYKGLAREELENKIKRGNYYDVVKLVNLGYRKLPEDSVVLSKEEYEKLKMLEESHITCEDVLEFVEKARKETAEKFANEVYKELYQLGKLYALPETLDVDKYGIFSLTQEVVAKIAKEQFGVEIKE